MNTKFRKLLLAVLIIAAPMTVYAVWPGTDSTTTNLDSDTDSPLAARPDLFDLATKFNQIRAHVSAFAQTLLDDADAAAARATLDAVGKSNNETITGTKTFSGSEQIFTTPLVGPIKVISTNGGTVGPSLTFYHNGGSQAAGDIVANIPFVGTTGVGDLTYGLMKVEATNVISGSATGRITFQTNNAGSGIGDKLVINADDVTLPVSLISTKACAGGYTRLTPNYCMANAPTSNSTSSFSCLQSVALTGVTTAKAVMLQLMGVGSGSNAVGQRTFTMLIYGPSDTTCASSQTATLDFRVYEHVATIGAMGSGSTTVVVPSNTSGQYYRKIISGDSLYATAIGYFD